MGLPDTTNNMPMLRPSTVPTVAHGTSGFMPTQLRRGIGRLPVVSKLHLGEKAVAASGKEYPKDVPYFVLPKDPWGEAIKKHYGKNPTELEVQFYGDFFQRAFRSWGSGAKNRSKGLGGLLKCESADGHTAMQADEKGMRHERLCPQQHRLAGLPIPEDMACPYMFDQGSTPRLACKEQLRLTFFLPRITVSGVFMLYTGSIHGMEALETSLTHYANIFGPKINSAVFVLSRKEKAIAFEGKESIHWPLSLELHPTCDAELQLEYLRRSPMAQAAFGGGAEVKVLESTNPIANQLADKQAQVDRMIEAAAMVVPPEYVPVGIVDMDDLEEEPFDFPEDEAQDADFEDIPMDDPTTEPEPSEIGAQGPEMANEVMPPVPQGDVSICKDCGGETWWAETTNDKRVRLDFEPVTNGTFTMENGKAKKRKGGEWTCHFDTCPKRKAATAGEAAMTPTDHRKALQKAFMRTQDEVGGDRASKMFARWMLKNFEHRLKNFASIPDDVAVGAGLELAAWKGERAPWG